MKRARNASALLFAALAALALVAACAGTQSYPRVHPEEVAEMPVCSECHEEWQAAYDHVEGFSRSHRFYASQDGPVCETCHAPSF